MSTLFPTLTARLAVESLSVSFGAHQVMHNVSLDVRPGEIHALIGQNGSGKSTLAKVLTGLYTPDAGTRVTVDGADLHLPIRPDESTARGVAVVHQSLGLVNDLSVLENMRVGRLRASRLLRRINWKREREEAEKVFDRLGRRVPLNAKVGTLREDERATVAIARALQDVTPGDGLIIFDESTRALGRRALEHFFQILDGIVATGTSVLLITHRLEEVVDAADRVTILRDGRVIEAGRTVEGLREHDLAGMMLGRTVEDIQERSAAEIDAAAQPVRFRGISGELVRDLSLDIAPGEVVGLTGLSGSGFSEVPYLVSGVTPASGGSVELPGMTFRLGRVSPADAIRAGIALVPEGRDQAGLVGNLSVAENTTFPQTSHQGRGWSPIKARPEHELVARWMDELDIKPRRPDILVKNLSGGNAQKVLMAKWLATSPTLLVLHEPTQAVDVGARHTIVQAVRKAAADYGCAVLVAGSDENELAMLSDRILVFSDGQVRQELSGDINPDEIVGAIYANGSRTRLRQRGVVADSSDDGER